MHIILVKHRIRRSSTHVRCRLVQTILSKSRWTNASISLQAVVRKRRLTFQWLKRWHSINSCEMYATTFLVSRQRSLHLGKHRVKLKSGQTTEWGLKLTLHLKITRPFVRLLKPRISFETSNHAIFWKKRPTSARLSTHGPST